MITLPSLEESARFEYENNFYLGCDKSRLSKLIAHYELFQKSLNVPGEIVECGVFKGAGLSKWIRFREIFCNKMAKKIIGFDTFGKFPETSYDDDIEYRKQFVDSAGDESIGKEQFMDLLRNLNLDTNVSLVEGDIRVSVPEFIKKTPHLEISLLNIDVDIYESTKFAIEAFFPHVARNGIVIVDDYSVFPGATKAIDDFFRDNGISFPISKFPFSKTPSYFIRE
jgi:hypothetical protein